MAACHSLVEHDDVMLLGVSASQANGKVVGLRPNRTSQQQHSYPCTCLWKSTGGERGEGDKDRVLRKQNTSKHDLTPSWRSSRLVAARASMTSDVAPARRCCRAGNASLCSTSSFAARQQTQPQGYSDQLQHKFQNRADTFAFIYATTSLYRYGTVTRDGCRAAVYKDHEPQLVSATWGVWQVRTVVQMKSTPHWQQWQTQFSFRTKKRETKTSKRQLHVHLSWIY